MACKPNSALTPAAKAERARYMREWRRRNPDKERQYNAAKWQRKADARQAEREARKE